MSTELIETLKWNAEGSEPSDNLKTNGFKAGYKPPADTFNFFFNRTYLALKQLQTEVDKKLDPPFGVAFGGGDSNSNTASGKYSMAAGTLNKVTAFASFAFGENNEATASPSFAAGMNNKANGNYSFVAGLNNQANFCQTVFGKLATNSVGPSGADDNSGDIFKVGIGTSTARANALRITTAGKTYGAQSFGGSGADFAELFEYADGNKENEDRRGRIVTIEGEKIRLAKSGDNILGIISTTASFIGDTASEEWHDKYLRDIFGERIIEIVEVPATKAEKFDEETGETITEIIPAHTEKRWKLNPDYDPNETYIPREERPEWGTVGLLGKVIAVDDGTCKAGEYCTAGENGIATYSAEKTKLYCMKRIDDTHIRVLVGA